MNAPPRPSRPRPAVRPHYEGLPARAARWRTTKGDRKRPGGMAGKGIPVMPPGSTEYGDRKRRKLARARLLGGGGERRRASATVRVGCAHRRYPLLFQRGRKGPGSGVKDGGPGRRRQRIRAITLVRSPTMRPLVAILRPSAAIYRRFTIGLAPVTNRCFALPMPHLMDNDISMTACRLGEFCV